MSSNKRKDPPENLHTSNRRASGKRYRTKRDPNSWESSILTIRSNILLLGMSYPSVTAAIEQFNLSSKVHIQHLEPSVEQAIELVRRKILNTIDGRDYARIKALEASNEMLAYTVSKEKGGPYESKRHLDADFNSRNFIKEMLRQWGVGYGMDLIKFRQGILDYFWIPPGTWQGIHWKPPFFRDNLPAFVTENLFNYGDIHKDTHHVHTTKDIEGGDYIASDAAVFYLPFCENCFVEVVAWREVLSKVYTIGFLPKQQLDEHTLWRATNTISEESMQERLEKKLNQEEDYCKLTRKKIVHGGAIGSNHVDRDAVLDVFDRIKNVEDVRMIKLTALRRYHPNFENSGKKWPCKRGVDVGGFVGLLKSAASKPSPTKAQARSKTPLKTPARPSTADEKSFFGLLASLLSQNDAHVGISKSGALKITSLSDLDDSLPIDFGGSAKFRKQLSKFGWKIRSNQTVVFRGKEEQVVYHNKAQAAELLSLFATMKNKEPKKKASKEAKPSKPPSVKSLKLPAAESIIDCDQVVLDFRNRYYKEVMYEQFRSMLDKKTKTEDAALNAIGQLKLVAMDLSKNSEKKSCELFSFDRSQRRIYVATEEETLKKVCNGIGRRMEFSWDWMKVSSTCRRSSRLTKSATASVKDPPTNETEIAPRELDDKPQTVLRDNNTIYEDASCRSRELTKHLENVTDGTKIVLSYNHTIYKELMYTHFRNMEGKHVNKEDLAKSILESLKQKLDTSIAEGNPDVNNHSINLYKRHGSGHEYIVDDEEAFAKIKADIGRRNETREKWKSAVSACQTNESAAVAFDNAVARNIVKPETNGMSNQTEQSTVVISTDSESTQLKSEETSISSDLDSDFPSSKDHPNALLLYAPAEEQAASRCEPESQQISLPETTIAGLKSEETLSVNTALEFKISPCFDGLVQDYFETMMKEMVDDCQQEAPDQALKSTNKEVSNIGDQMDSETSRRKVDLNVCETTPLEQRGLDGNSPITDSDMFSCTLDSDMYIENQSTTVSMPC